MPIMDTPFTQQDLIIQGLVSDGWYVQDNALPPSLIVALEEQLRLRWQQGQLHEAAIGRGERRGVNHQIRSDWIQWLETEQTSSPAEITFLQTIEQFRQKLNAELFLGLNEYEGHLALYPPGSRYQKHLDQFKGVGLRTVTLIIYLNSDWQEENGGQLRLYHHLEEDSRYTDILPIGGRLVCFLSAQFPHEVLSATRERLSITGWYKIRDPYAPPI